MCAKSPAPKAVPQEEESLETLSRNPHGASRCSPAGRRVPPECFLFYGVMSGSWGHRYTDSFIRLLHKS